MIEPMKVGDSRDNDRDNEKGSDSGCILKANTVRSLKN